jgi:hypothetical protein
MFEPTEGCPHLQPLELMAMAEKSWLEEGGDKAREQSKVRVVELTPGHMFKAIETFLSFDGRSWVVSKVDRHLTTEGLEPGTQLV